jgi:hypothetical protein
MTESATVSLLRWLRLQMAQPSVFREHLEAAVSHGDPAEVRRLIQEADFSEGQRRYLNALVDSWEAEVRAAERPG